MKTEESLESIALYLKELVEISRDHKNEVEAASQAITRQAKYIESLEEELRQFYKKSKKKSK